MRLFFVLVAIGALSQPAFALSPECKSIADSAARLACYDKAAAPLTSAGKSAPAKSEAAAKPNTTKYVDSISAEDARMNAQIKNICRGC
jgi:hypothetical protein